MKVFNRKKARQKRHARIRRHVLGTSQRPRLVVFRSLKNIEGQIVDDERGITLLGVSSLSKEVERSGKTRMDLSKIVGKLIAKKALGKGISKITFDRNGYLYHGRIKAFAEGAREGGLQF
ncbi:MAG TPA: 50S ribosomal protein L18 [archaeon]|nr:50S ribosomal protein L18 [archaeon]